MIISALILAAGEGSRIGIPKAILNIKGEFLADIQYETLMCANISDIRIVLGAEAKRVIALLKNRDNLIINENYRYGQFSSLVKGIESITKGYDGLLVLPVDVYPLEIDIIRRLISEFEIGYDAIIPCYNGRGGHPVILSHRFCRQIIKNDITNSRLDYLLRESVVKRVDIESSCVLNNINRPTDLV